jgi:hypothetical protein
MFKRVYNINNREIILEQDSITSFESIPLSKIAGDASGIIIEEYEDDKLLRSYEYYDSERSIEGDHSTSPISLVANHRLNLITDTAPEILIPGDVKNSKNINTFKTERELYAFVNKNIASFLIGNDKKLHRVIPSNDTENVEVDNIHVCNVNGNERLCYTVFFSIKYNKIVIVILCYFAHNKGTKSASGEYKKNPSKAEFTIMKKYKNYYLNNYCNVKYPNGDWQNV